MLLKMETKALLAIGCVIIAIFNFLRPTGGLGFETHGLAYEIGAITGSHLSGIIATIMFIVIGINLTKEIKLKMKERKKYRNN